VRHLATDTPSDVERFDAFLEYLVTVGFADEDGIAPISSFAIHTVGYGRTLPDRSVFDNKLCRRNEASELVAGDVLPTTGGTHLGIRREGRATVATLIQGGRAGRANANQPREARRQDPSSRR